MTFPHVVRLSNFWRIDVTSWKQLIERDRCITLSQAKSTQSKTTAYVSIEKALFSMQGQSIHIFMQTIPEAFARSLFQMFEGA